MTGDNGLEAISNNRLEIEGRILCARARRLVKEMGSRDHMGIKTEDKVGMKSYVACNAQGHVKAGEESPRLTDYD